MLLISEHVDRLVNLTFNEGHHFRRIYHVIAVPGLVFKARTMLLDKTPRKGSDGVRIAPLDST